MKKRELSFYRSAVCILTILYYLSATAPFWLPGTDALIFPLAFLLYYVSLSLLGMWSVRSAEEPGPVLLRLLGIPALLVLLAVVLSLLCYPQIPYWGVLEGKPFIHSFISSAALLLAGYAWGGWLITGLAVVRCLSVCSFAPSPQPWWKTAA